MCSSRELPHHLQAVPKEIVRAVLSVRPMKLKSILPLRAPANSQREQVPELQIAETNFNRSNRNAHCDHLLAFVIAALRMPKREPTMSHPGVERQEMMSFQLASPKQR